MTLRLASSSTAAILAILSALAACGGDAALKPGSTAGQVAGNASPVSGGSGGAITGSQNAAATAAGSSGNSSAGVSGSASSSAGSSGGNSIAPTFETVKLVLQGGGAIMPCAAAPCHGVHGMAPPGRPLELPPNDDQQLYTNLTSYISTACGNRKLVTPGDPAQSAILSIIRGPCGATPRMPYMCSEQDDNCIPAEYIAAIEQWIVSGAPKQ